MAWHSALLHSLSGILVFRTTLRTMRQHVASSVAAFYNIPKFFNHGYNAECAVLRQEEDWYVKTVYLGSVILTNTMSLATAVAHCKVAFLYLVAKRAQAS